MKTLNGDRINSILYKQLLPTLLVAILSACGGSSSDTPTTLPELPPVVNEPTLLTGVFIDSAVEGLRFETATQSGTTDENGEFIYQTGEMITFSLGDIIFPTILATEQISPLEIFETTDYYDTPVINLARLLQTLDKDGNTANGIELDADLHNLATGLSVDFSASDFDLSVTNLVANNGGVLTELIDGNKAVNHLIVSLNSDRELQNCAATHQKVGYSGLFTSRAHGVMGKATIANDCTILVTDFSYDGQGPSVYFYAATNHAYDSNNAFLMGNLLNGTVFENNTLVFNIPANKTLDDFDSLSVWCDQFNASFGDLVFSEN